MFPGNVICRTWHHKAVHQLQFYGHFYFCPLGGNTVARQDLKEQCASVSVWGATETERRSNAQQKQQKPCLSFIKCWLNVFQKHSICVPKLGHVCVVFVDLDYLSNVLCLFFVMRYIHVYCYDPLQRGPRDLRTTWYTVERVYKMGRDYSFRLSSAMSVANPMICTLPLCCCCCFVRAGTKDNQTPP